MAIQFNRPGDTQPPGGHVSASQAAGNKTAGTTLQSPATAPGHPQGEAVHLSSDALRLQDVAEKLAVTPEPVDLEKVAALRQAIAEGQYSVDSTAVADKITVLEARF